MRWTWLADNWEVLSMGYEQAKTYVKKTMREADNQAKETWRRADGEESVSDKIANTGDDIRTTLGNAGDDVRAEADKWHKDVDKDDVCRVTTDCVAVRRPPLAGGRLFMCLASRDQVWVAGRRFKREPPARRGRPIEAPRHTTRTSTNRARPSVHSGYTYGRAAGGTRGRESTPARRLAGSRDSAARTRRPGGRTRQL